MRTLTIANPYPSPSLEIKKGFSPREVILPVAGLDIMVSIGDSVIIGQIIAKGTHYVHASICAVVSDIVEHAFPHPSGLNTLCVVLTNNFEHNIHTYDTHSLHDSKEELREVLHSSGIVGLGGAGFGTHTKLESFLHAMKSGQHSLALIINATECEPASEADHALGIEYAVQVLEGIELMMYIADIPRAIIAIENNKPDLYTALHSANTHDTIEIRQVEPIYASGAEKVLIQTLLGIRIDKNEYAIQRGVLTYNIATIKVVADYVLRGHALTHRVVTITGDALTPYNALLPIGTPIREICEHAPIIRTNGVMMGIDISDHSAPILKTTNAVLCNTHIEKNEVSECIKCSQCVNVCPAELLPQQLYFFIKGDNIDKAISYDLEQCILCRCCDEVCPSNIALSQYFSFGKSKYKQQQQELELAELSKKRFEFRTQRIERNKKEREEMMAKKREEAKKKLIQMQANKHIEEGEKHAR